MHILCYNQILLLVSCFTFCLVFFQAVSRHVEYYLRWCWALLTTYGRLLQGSDSMAHQESLRALIRAISIHETEILKMSDDNHFTLSFITSQCGIDTSTADTKATEELSGDKSVAIKHIEEAVYENGGESDNDSNDERVSQESIKEVVESAGEKIEEMSEPKKLKKRKEVSEGDEKVNRVGSSSLKVRKISKKLRTSVSGQEENQSTEKTSLVVQATDSARKFISKKLRKKM